MAKKPEKVKAVSEETVDESVKSKKNRNAKKEKAKIDRSEIIALIKNTFIMLAITLVAGGILGFVYELTKEPIAQMEIQKKQEANKKVFAKADSFSETPEAVKPLLESFEYEGADISDCLEAYDESGAVIGYVLEVVAHGGYGGDIVFQIGITNEAVINAISITSISETAGLGMRAPEVLAPQFKNKAAQNYEVIKTERSEENQIVAISSATITSKAVTNGVNAAVEFFNNYLTGGIGNE